MRGFKSTFTALIPVTILTTAAAAGCWIVSPPASCCSLASGVDLVGNCSPWAHSCPDIPTANPMASQVVEVGLNQGGKQNFTTTPLTCQYQPRKCKFIGCSNSGPVATAGCNSDTPSGLNCPSSPPE